jgi:F-box/leucine-rich repeat protein 10/11
VPQKFRFPFFTEMLWYMLDRYIHCLYGRTHLDLPEEEKRRLRLEKGENIDPNKEFMKMARLGGAAGGSSAGRVSNVHISPLELNGIKYAVMYLHYLPASKKNVPLMLPDPIAVIKDIRQLVLDHKDDDGQLAITGKYVLRWTESDDVDHPKRVRKSLPKSLAGQVDKKKPASDQGNNTAPVAPVAAPPVPIATPSPVAMPPLAAQPPANSGDKSPGKKGSAAGNRRRRVRCKACDACMGGDCKFCVYCKDMTKYGGPGRMKQTCEKVSVLSLCIVDLRA